MEPFYVPFQFFFYVLKQVHIYFSSLEEFCFAVKLQKCFCEP